MKTQIITINAYSIHISWGDDLKSFVKYYTKGKLIADWHIIPILEQSLISVVVDTFCTEEGLTKWSY